MIKGQIMDAAIADSKTKLRSSPLHRKGLVQALIKLMAGQKKTKARFSQDQKLLDILDALPFKTAFEKRIFCLDLALLIKDVCFPLVWDKRHLALLLNIQRRRQPISGFVDLTIPVAWQNGTGLGFYSLLKELVKELYSQPETSLHWLVVLRMLDHKIRIADIAQLTIGAGLNRFDARQLQELKHFAADQLQALSRLMADGAVEDPSKLNLLFFFIRKNTFPGKKVRSMTRLLIRFMKEILPAAESRLNYNFTQSRSGKAARDAYSSAYGLFFLWLLHQKTAFPLLFNWEQAEAIAAIDFSSANYKKFRALDFHKVIVYLPKRCLINIPLFLNQNADLLIHLAAGQNVRRFSGLRLPVGKKMAHQFHNLPLIEISDEDLINASFRSAYWKALQVDDRVLHIAEHYAKFEWILCSGRVRSRRRLNQFSRWEEVLRKFVYLSEKHPLLLDMPMEDYQALFGYLQHRIDENLPLNLSGCTLKSLQRRVRDWQREAQRRRQADQMRAKKIAKTWKGAPIRKFNLKSDGNHYQIVQLKNLNALVTEGLHMKHCVASYHQRCASSVCSIWSLRKLHHNVAQLMATIEVDPNGQIVQVRAKHNAQPDTLSVQLIKKWAVKEGLKY